MMPTRQIVWMLSLSLGLAAVVPARTAAPASPALSLWGPPVMCHPIAFVGGPEVESIPFGADRFAALDDLDRTAVAELVVGKLGASDDAFFHMETVRRGLVYLAWGEEPLESEIERLVKALEGRVDAAKEDMASASKADALQARRDYGLATFDLAWALEGLQELRLDPRSEKARDRALEEALAHRGDDEALQLGAAILSLARHDEKALSLHLGRALHGVDDESSLLVVNANNTIGSMTGVRGLRQLVAFSENPSKRV